MQTELTFRLVGQPQPLILVPAYVNGGGPFQFILDTGSGTSIVSPDLASKLRLVSLGSKDGTGAAGKVTVQLTTIESLAVGESIVKNMQIAISAEIERIRKAVGTPVDGDLGHDFLKNFVVIVDYPNNMLRFMQQTRLATSAIKFRLADPEKPLILIPAVVEGIGPLNFALDTGASTTVISPRLSQQLKLDSTAVTRMTAAGGTVPASVVSLISLSVAGQSQKNVRVVVADFIEMISEVAGVQLDGILGYNYLRNFKVTIDYPEERLLLE